MSSEGSDGEDRTANASRVLNRGRPCPLCAAPMYQGHCKYVCPEHGVVYDCSDTFY